jgi:hypothetical protein
MATSVTHRHLEFQQLSDIAAEARRLLASGYQPAGNWNLAQVCQHLNEWLRFPIDGYPAVPIFLRPMFWILRHTIGPAQLKKILATKSFPKNGPTMPSTVFPADRASDGVAVHELTATIDRFEKYQGPMHASPLFGAMDRQTHVRLQLVHAGHHLGFLIPRSSG